MTAALTTLELDADINSHVYTNIHRDIKGNTVRDRMLNMNASFLNKIDDSGLLGLAEYNLSFIYYPGKCCVKNNIVYQAINQTTGPFAAGDWDPIFSFITTDVIEGTNLYYTDARVIAAPLTGYVSGVGVVSAADSILSAIQKINGNIAALPVPTLAQVLSSGNDGSNTYVSNIPYIEYGQSTINIQNSELKYGPGAAALNWNTKILGASHWDYDSDYSGTYTTRSLVDKGYVTSAIASGVSAYLPLAGGTLSGDILFTGGKGIDTSATGGTDTLNIGGTNADVINIGRAGATVNILGAALYEYAANQYVLDKLITLNYGGAISSGTGVGFEIEENNVITGYFKTNVTRDGFVMLAPANIYGATLSVSALTNDRTYTLPDATGTIALTSDLASGYIPYTGATTNVDLGVRTLTNSTNITSPLLYGSSAVNGNITIEGTSSPTKTTSYIILQPTGGGVGIGTVNPVGSLYVVGNASQLAIGLSTNSATVAGVAALSFYTQTNRGLGSQIMGTALSGLELWTSNGNVRAMSLLQSGNVGIGTTVPLSKVGITGNLSVGATYGAIAAPTSGAIIEGKIGIGTSTVGNGSSIQVTIASAGGGGLELANTTSAGGGAFVAVAGGGLAIYTTVGAVGAVAYTERMRITSGGNVDFGVLAADIAAANISISKPITGGTNAYGVYLNSTIQSGVTTNARMFISAPSTAASVFNAGSIIHFQAAPNVFGAGSAAANEWGFLAGNFSTATNNYGFYGTLSAGTNKYNCYMGGTAQNYFAGNVGIGTTAPAEKLDVMDGEIRVSYTGVVNPFTTIIGALNVGKIYSLGNSAGGLAIMGTSAGNSIGTTLYGEIGTATPSLTTAALRFQSGKLLGTTAGAQAATETAFQFYNHSTHLVTILGSGNVGIGTITPTAKIQSVSTSPGVAAVSLFLQNSDAAIGTETRIAFAANTNGDIATGRYSYISALNTSGSNGQALIFATNISGASATEKMRITDAGALGIGTGSTISAKTHILSATEQLRLGYDVSNYYSTTVSSTGIITLDAIGSGARFVYLDGITLAAGTTAVSPLKYISGPLLSIIAIGEKGYNGSFYSTNGALNRLGEGGVLFDNFADIGNVTTGQTDLYSYTTKANTFAVNGEKIEAGYGGIFVGHATATRNVTVVFAGNTIFDSGIINNGGTTNWELFVTIIRVNADTIRYKISMLVLGSAMASIGPFVSVGELTGLTLTGTNILKLTATAGAAGAATNDIVARLGSGKWFAAANN